MKAREALDDISAAVFAAVTALRKGSKASRNTKLPCRLSVGGGLAPAPPRIAASWFCCDPDAAAAWLAAA